MQQRVSPVRTWIIHGGCNLHEKQRYGEAVRRYKGLRERHSLDLYPYFSTVALRERQRERKKEKTIVLFLHKKKSTVSPRRQRPLETLEVKRPRCSKKKKQKEMMEETLQVSSGFWSTELHQVLSCTCLTQKQLHKPAKSKHTHTTSCCELTVGVLHVKYLNKSAKRDLNRICGVSR